MTIDKVKQMLASQLNIEAEKIKEYIRRYIPAYELEETKN